MTTPVDRIRGYHAELTEIRRDLHANPELAFEETRTSSLVIEYLKKLVEQKKYKPLIDRVYDFTELVEATRYVETGQKVGNVVIQVVNK